MNKTKLVVQEAMRIVSKDVRVPKCVRDGKVKLDKKMKDNFEQIEKLLIFDSEDDFYHLQILKRKKENPEIGSNSYVVRTYCIRSKESLMEKRTEITEMCNTHNARAYINLSPRSFEKMAFHTLKKISDIIMNKDYKEVRKAFESVCGTYGNGKHKRWVIDIDWENFADESIIQTKIIPLLAKLQREAGREKPLLECIPTKNGIHIITYPFDSSTFRYLHPNVDLHKNNPTILYQP
jgi:hypothetical protein